jgi:hypothetical protein
MKFNIVLDDCIRLIRLAKKSAAVPGRLVSRIGDLVPDDRSKVAEPDCTAVLLDSGVQGNDGVFALVAAA